MQFLLCTSCCLENRLDYPSKVKRQNQARGCLSRTAELPIEVLKEIVHRHVEGQPPPDQAAADVLRVMVAVREPVITEQRVYVLFSCQGMLNRCVEAKGRHLKLVVDGKQKLVVNEYAVVTLVAHRCVGRAPVPNTRFWGGAVAGCWTRFLGGAVSFSKKRLDSVF